MDDDHGYFGKGLSGYVHYNEAFKRTSGSGGGGNGGGGGGCGTGLIVVSVILFILYLIGKFS